MSLLNLAAKMRDLQKQIPVRVALATNKVAEVILETAAESTPYDTTKALSNWQVSLGTRSFLEIEARVPGKAGSTRPLSLAMTKADGISEMQGRKVGVEIHIVNNASYIDDLNVTGAISQQAGEFVQKAILQGRLQVQKTIIRLD